METFYLFLGLAWSILCLILFFKIWGMTNDVREIKTLLANKESEKSIPTDNALNDNNPIKVGDKVQHEFYNKDKNMFVSRINNDGSCMCVDEKGKEIATYSLEKLKKIN